MTRLTRMLSLVAVLALGIAACSSGGHAPAPTAACGSASPTATLPPPVGNPAPGQARWSVRLDRCTGTPHDAWSQLRTGPVGVLGSDNELFMDLSGTVSRFDLSTGTRAWQRSVVAPTSTTNFIEMQASGDLVVAEFTVGGGPSKYTFLDAGTGAPVGAMNQTIDGEPTLVDGHVVIGTNSGIEGYDPATATITWQVAGQAPAGIVHDGTTIYLDPAAGSAAIVRVDAATGHVLAPLPLPAAAHLPPALTDVDSAGQGLLMLAERSASPGAPTGPGGTIGYPIVRSVAVTIATDALAWSRSDEVVTTDSGPFSTIVGSDGIFTAVDPRTGKDLWTVAPPGLGSGPYEIEAVPDYLVVAADGNESQDGGTVAGISPPALASAHPAWHTGSLTRVQFVAADQDTAVVTTCDPWGSPQNPSECADRALIAIAL